MACVAMAVAMQRRMHELRAQWLTQGLERPLNSGSASTRASARVGQFRQRRPNGLHDHRGEVNLASRLQSHADLGGILLAGETFALVKDEIEAEELPPLTVKGFSYDIKTYRVIGPRIDLECHAFGPCGRPKVGNRFA